MSAWLEEELRSITATDDKHIAPSYGLEARPGESLDFRYQDAAAAVRQRAVPSPCRPIWHDADTLPTTPGSDPDRMPALIPTSKNPPLEGFANE